MKIVPRNRSIVTVLLLLAVFAASCAQVKEEKPTTKPDDMKDFEILVNAMLPFIEDMLKKNGEFFPIAAAIDKNKKIVQIGTNDGKENPTSQSVIDDLKSGLREGAEKREYEAVAIFYDAKVVNPNTKQKTDAVAVFVENAHEAKAFKIFYQYSLTKDRVLTFGESWKNATAKEIFVKSQKNFGK